jgi:hypothetical protein
MRLADLSPQDRFNLSRGRRLGDLLQPQARWPPTGQPPDAIALDAHSLEALVGIQPGSQSF